MGWSANDIPDQSGRVAVVTGANSGLGLETARELARTGARVAIACRDTSKGDEAATSILGDVPGAELLVRRLDLADLTSVREFAAGIEQELSGGIDLLINNAGVMATPRRETADGFELQIGTNHLGHFALTGLLLPRLKDRDGARVVTVSSAAHRIGGVSFTDLQSRKRYSRWGAYGQSKIANLLFAFELQRRLQASGAAAASMAAHPGYSATHLQSSGPAMGGGAISTVNTLAARFGNLVIAQDAKAGALPTLFAATAPNLPGGSFAAPDGPFEMRGAPKIVTARKLAYNEDVAARLWQLSEELTGVAYELPAAAPA